MSLYTLLRLAVMLLFGLAGWELGAWLTDWISSLPGFSLSPTLVHWSAAAGAAGLGYLTGPILTLGPARSISQRLQHLPGRTLVMGMVGLTAGLLAAALLAMPLAMLPGSWGRVLPLASAVLLGTLGATLVGSRNRDFLAVLDLMAGRELSRRSGRTILLDTSVIIDGRIADICATGFINDTLLAPQFVLEELQHIAGSADPLRRRRGRRGLDVLDRLQQDPHVTLETLNANPSGAVDVDAKLIATAQQFDYAILTNDYNLNRIAGLQRVEVLNINELANAVKSVVLPGEPLTIDIIQEGKELGQGVGYLDDGTMVVVEDGRRQMHTTCEVIVTRVLQTVAGKMIFAQIPGRPGNREAL